MDIIDIVKYRKKEIYKMKVLTITRFKDLF